uniref:Secreted C13 protease-like protein n=1 Tax=Pristhesancus plagipennis TaxID=1955184 RepID=A0A2K8JM03_PRIPG|nr:secreted C13 protease-like protein [Pristhesancus plagipennis]
MFGNLAILLVAFAVILPSKCEQADENIINEINNMDLSWKAGRNFEEGGYVRRLLAKSKPRPAKTLPVVSRFDSDVVIPDKFDSRLEWPECPTISHIQDQGACGACWAVAGAATFSDRVCVASKGKTIACDGGDDYRAWVFFRINGVTTGGDYNTTEGCQPYTVEPCEHHTEGSRPNCYAMPEPVIEKCQNECTNKNYGKSMTQDLFKVSRAYKVMSDVNQIKREILKHGPVQAGFTVYEDFNVYKTGIYRHTVGNKVGEHSVRILGWGWEGNQQYWLVANSWNYNWGENGTFRVAMGVNECGIEEAVHAGIPIIE